MRKFLIFAIFLVGVFFVLSISDKAYGHGLGYELMPPVKVGDKEVVLEISSNVNAETKEKEIKFSLIDAESNITVRDTTFDIKLIKNDKELFEKSFESDDGILTLNLIPSESEEVIFVESEKSFDKLFNLTDEITEIESSFFNYGGLYKFEIKILTIDNFSNILEEPVVYDTGISLMEQTTHEIDDLNFGKNEFGIRTYYDLIENFKYENNKKMISFSFPFEWTTENIGQTTVVHNEILVPKSFGDLMVAEFNGIVNGVKLQDGSVYIDDFSEESRLIHVVINQEGLKEIFEKNKESIHGINIEIIPSSDLPLNTITDNAQFKINLKWDPYNLESGEKIKILFQIQDVFLMDKSVAVNYDLEVKQNENLIFSQKGVSSGINSEWSEAEFLIPDDISGKIDVALNKINENDFANAKLPIIINKISDNERTSGPIIPEWIKNNAGWWSENKISDNDFVQGIQYLIKTGIIVI